MILKRPGWKWIAGFLLGPPLLLGILAGAGIAWINSPGGLEWLRRTLVEQVGRPGEFEISIQKLEGSLWSELRVEGLGLSDGEGEWLTLDRGRLSWQPSALFDRRLEVLALEGGRLAIERSPQAPPERAEDQQPPGKVEPPGLPLSLRIQRLAVEEIELGAALAGTAARLTLEGTLRSEDSSRVITSLALAQVDGALRLDLNADYDLASEALKAELEASDEAGGLLARLAGDPALPAMALSLSGDAPWRSWQGEIDARLEGMAELTGRIALDLQEAPGLSYSGRVALPMLSEGPAGALLEGGAQVDLALRLPDDQTLTIEKAEVETAALRASTAGRINLSDLTSRLDLTAELLDPAPVMALAPGVVLTGGSLALTQEGALAYPSVRGGGSISGLQLPGGPRLDAADLTISADADSEAALRWRLGLAVEGQGFALAAEEALARLAGSMIGSAPSLSFEGFVDLTNQELVISQARLSAASVSAETSGLLPFDGREAGLDLSVSLADLAPLSSLAGRPLAGSALLEASTSLLLDGPRAEGNFTLSAAGLDLDDPLATSLLGAPVLMSDFLFDAGGLTLSNIDLRGEEVTLTGGLALGPAFDRLTGDYDLQLRDLAKLRPMLAGLPEGGARLTGQLSGPIATPATSFQLQAPGLGLTGDLRLTPESPLPQGDLLLSLLDPVPWDQVTGLPGLEAKGELALTLLTRGGLPAADVRAQLSSLSLPGGPAVKNLTMTGRADDLLGEITIAADARLSETELAPLQLSSLNASATGGLSALDFTLSGQGRLANAGRQLPLALDVSGRAQGLDQPEKKISLLQGGSLSLAGHNLDLTDAIALTSSSQRLLLSAPGLALDDGSLALTYDRGAETAELSLSLDGLPLTLADLAMAEPPQGRLSGRLSVKGAGQAKGDLAFAITELVLSEDESLPPLSGEITGRLTGTALELSVVAQGPAGGPIEEPLRALASLPMSLDLMTPSATLRQDAPISGSVNWNSPVKPLAQLFAPPNISLAGLLSLDATLGGSLAAPALEGEARLREGRFEHLEQGSFLQDVTVTADFNGDRITFSEISAHDSLKGSITGEGTIAMAPEQGFPLALSLDLTDLRVISSDQVKANIGGQIKTEGSLNDMTVTARLTTQEINISLANDLPPEVVDLEPIPVDALAQGEEGEEPPPALLQKIKLDIEVQVPNRLFVRGRGLQSEWQGGVKVAGTAAAPAIAGQLNVVRGEMSLIGKRFILREGVIRLPSRPGSPPVLDILAVHETSSLEARVRVSGPTDNIAIELSSVPEYPQDEILARVLFNKSGGELTATEALQLASAVAQLTGRGGPGLLDRARSTLGVDVLRVQSGDGEAGPSVEAGSYIAEDVYVGVEQGADPRSGAVSVELGITDNIAVESKLNQSGSSNIGIMFEWDY